MWSLLSRQLCSTPRASRWNFERFFIQNWVQRIFEIIWFQDLVLVCQSGKELRSSTLLIAAIFPWVTNHSSYVQSTHIKYKSIANTNIGKWAYLSMGDQSSYVQSTYQVQINCKCQYWQMSQQNHYPPSTKPSYETWWRMPWRTSTSVCLPSLYNKSPPISTQKWELPLKVIFSSNPSIHA